MSDTSPSPSEPSETPPSDLPSQAPSSPPSSAEPTVPQSAAGDPAGKTRSHGCLIGTGIAVALVAAAGIGLYTMRQDVLVWAMDEQKGELVNQLRSMGVTLSEQAAQAYAAKLLEAVRGAQPEESARLLSYGVPADGKDEQGKSLLEWALGNGAAAQMEQLLAHGADPNAVFSDGDTALIAALKSGKPELLDLLIRRGASLEQANKQGVTPLEYAIGCDQPALLSQLLKAGAPVQQACSSGESPLLCAVRLGKVEAVQALLDAGGDANAPSPKGEHPVLIAAQADDAGLVKLLLDHLKEKGQASAYSESSLVTLAVTDGKLAVLECLLERNTGLRELKEKGVPVLELAVNSGKPATALLLLKHGVDPKASYGGGAGLLQSALAMGRDAGELVAALVAAGVDTSAKDSQGNNLIMQAADKGDSATLEHVDKLRLPVNARNAKGLTALHLAVQGGHADAAELLLKHGAGVNDRDIQGNTPLMMAVINGDKEMLRVLMRHKAALMLCNRAADTAFTLALQYGNLEIADALLLAGDPLELTAQERGSLDKLVGAHAPNMPEDIKANLVARLTEYLEKISKRVESPADSLLSRAEPVSGKSWGEFSSRGIDTLSDRDVEIICSRATLDNGDYLKQRELPDLSKYDYDVKRSGGDLYRDDQWEKENYLVYALTEDSPHLLRFLIPDHLSRFPEGTGVAHAAMQLSAIMGKPAITQLLLDMGCSPEATTANCSLSPLVLAAGSGATETALLLLRAGASVEAKDAEGNTPLMLAAKRGNLRLSQELLAMGASTSATNKAGETALSLALQSPDDDATKDIKAKLIQILKETQH